MGIIDIKVVRFYKKSRFVGQNKSFYGISRDIIFREKDNFILVGLENKT